LLHASRKRDQFLVLRWLLGRDHSILIYTARPTPDVDPGPANSTLGPSLVLHTCDRIRDRWHMVGNWPTVAQ
jgi:hypothetical protein